MSASEMARTGALAMLGRASALRAGRSWSVARSLVYLHLLVFIGQVPLTALAHRRVVDYVERHGPLAADTFPRILIQDGRLRPSPGEEGPRVWIEPASGARWLVVDPGGQVDSLQGRPERVLVGQGFVEVAPPGRAARRVGTAAIPALLVDGQAVSEWLGTARRLFPWLHWPLMVVARVTALGLQATACALAFVALSRRGPSPMGVPAAFGLASLAMTLPFTLSLAGVALGWGIPGALAALAGLALGARAMARTPAAQPSSP